MNDRYDVATRIQSVTAERILISDVEFSDMACAQRVRFEVTPDEIRKRMMYSLQTYIHGLGKERISVHETWPTTWWDAFKERWLSGWMSRWFPVHYSRVDIEQDVYAAVCPHLQDQDQRHHFEWMAAQLPIGEPK